jgi:hypothetical protein
MINSLFEELGKQQKKERSKNIGFDVSLTRDT